MRLCANPAPPRSVSASRCSGARQLTIIVMAREYGEDREGAGIAGGMN
jgi:hypothetical protein